MVDAISPLDQTAGHHLVHDDVLGRPDLGQDASIQVGDLADLLPCSQHIAFVRDVLEDPYVGSYGSLFLR